MSLHINRFLDRLRAAEGRRDREIIMTLPEARDLHNDITRLLVIVDELRQHTANTSTQPVEIEVSGGSF